MEAREERGGNVEQGKQKAAKLTGDKHEMSSNFKSDIDNEYNKKKGTLPGKDERSGTDNKA